MDGRDAEQFGTASSAQCILAGGTIGWAYALRQEIGIDAIGAKITIKSGDFERHQFKVGGGSYLSSHTANGPGIGEATKIDWLEIQWPQPSGKTERITELPIDRYITIVEGEGKWK